MPLIGWSENAHYLRNIEIRSCHSRHNGLRSLHCMTKTNSSVTRVFPIWQNLALKSLVQCFSCFSSLCLSFISFIFQDKKKSPKRLNLRRKRKNLCMRHNEKLFNETFTNNEQECSLWSITTRVWVEIELSIRYKRMALRRLHKTLRDATGRRLQALRCRLKKLKQFWAWKEIKSSGNGFQRWRWAVVLQQNNWS